MIAARFNSHETDFAILHQTAAGIPYDCNHAEERGKM